ncbi:MAG: helix-turn-helix domain-containing protein [Chloroflexi bacterium]|nr:helix-turn-helix domain-containing protein [Chloroflexota bacterium]
MEIEKGNAPMADDWITVRDACQLSGYHPDHIRRIIRSGEVKARKFATVWQVNRPSLLAYIKKQEDLGERRGPKPLT